MNGTRYAQSNFMMSGWSEMNAKAKARYKESQYKGIAHFMAHERYLDRRNALMKEHEKSSLEERIKQKRILIKARRKRLKRGKSAGSIGKISSWSN